MLSCINLQMFYGPIISKVYMDSCSLVITTDLLSGPFSIKSRLSGHLWHLLFSKAGLGTTRLLIIHPAQGISV